MGGDKHPFDLRRGKRQVLAKGIHRIHQPFGRQGRKHFGADVLDVVIGAISVFRRQGVGRQARAAHADRQLFTETTDDPQDLAFAGEVKAVA